jgi:hypothetical protein
VIEKLTDVRLLDEIGRGTASNEENTDRNTPEDNGGREVLEKRLPPEIKSTCEKAVRFDVHHQEEFTHAVLLCQLQEYRFKLAVE